jgi:hypothetical protein
MHINLSQTNGINTCSHVNVIYYGKRQTLHFIRNSLDFCYLFNLYAQSIHLTVTALHHHSVSLYSIANITFICRLAHILRINFVKICKHTHTNIYINLCTITKGAAQVLEICEQTFKSAHYISPQDQLHHVLWTFSWEHFAHTHTTFRLRKTSTSTYNYYIDGNLGVLWQTKRDWCYRQSWKWKMCSFSNGKMSLFMQIVCTLHLWQV